MNPAWICLGKQCVLDGAMSSIPTICPNCYKSIHAPVMMPDGFVRCDSCGHAFPPTGASPYSTPSSAAQPFGPPPFSSSPPPYSGSVPGASLPPIGGYTPASYQPSYPPVGGPQKQGSPGLVACGVVVALGLMASACCGGGAFLIYTKTKDIAQNNPPINFPQPPP